MARVFGLFGSSFDGEEKVIHWILASILISLCALFAKLASDGGFPFARYFEKIGTGLLLAGYGFFYHISWYYCLAVIAVNFAVRSLFPLTLKGSSIWKAPWWVPIAMFANGLIPMPLGLHQKWLLSLFIAIGYSGMASSIILASNVDLTAPNAKWTWVRMLNGALLGIVASLTVIGSIPQ